MLSNIFLGGWCEIMNKTVKNTAMLSILLGSVGAIMPSHINVAQVRAEASTVEGIESIAVCKGSSDASLKLYKDSSFDESTSFKRSISKYYVKLPSNETKFNIDVDTNDSYTCEIKCDDDDYDSGDEIPISMGETLEAKIKIYDEDDHFAGTVTIEIKRLTEDDELDESKKKTKTTSTNTSSSNNTTTTNTNTTPVVKDGKTMATGIDIANSSYYSNGYALGNTEQGNVNNRDKWVQKGLNWQYYDENGNILRNKWKQTNGKWYYLQTNGYMTTGWRFIDKNWYYFDKTGAMVTGWMKDTNEKWYYFKPDGSMAANTVVEGYRINARGELAK